MNIIVHNGKTIPAFTNPKHPNAILDYGMVWDDWLDDDETIINSDWTSDIFTIYANESLPSPIEVCGTTFSRVEVVWLSQGTVGLKGIASNTILTSKSRTQVRSFYLWCSIV